MSDDGRPVGPGGEVKAAVGALFDPVADVYDSVVDYFARFGRRLVEAADLRPGAERRIWRAAAAQCWSRAGSGRRAGLGARDRRGAGDGASLLVPSWRPATRRTPRCGWAMPSTWSCRTRRSTRSRLGSRSSSRRSRPRLARGAQGAAPRRSGRAVDLRRRRRVPVPGRAGGVDRRTRPRGIRGRRFNESPVLCAALLEEGFRVVEQVEMAERFHFATVDDVERWQRSTGIRRLLESLDDHQLATYRAGLAARWNRPGSGRRPLRARAAGGRHHRRRATLIC